MTLLYFAYGSNMSAPRLQARVPSATPLGRARLPGHQLRFHKHSRVDGSAKCDACHTGRCDDVVHGVLFHMAAAERQWLDQAEGLGCGYQIKQVRVSDRHDREHLAFLYYATDIDPALKPFDWYRHHVLHGARQAGLPDAYITALESVPVIDDPQLLRRARELAIYHSN